MPEIRPKFSVIVPVYNVEQYLGTCVQSVLSQTFLEFELILVDDGSPDRCGKMCDDYVVNNERVRVVHKDNGGLSSARNAGLDIANGEYIIFLDSDDFWDDKQALENIYRNLSETDADILLFPAKRYYGETESCTYLVNMEVERVKVTNPDVNAAITYLVKHNIYRAAAWNKVVRRTLIEDNRMRFKEGYLSEDMDWCGDLLLYAKRFDWYGVPFYAYRQSRAGSITQQKSEKLVADKLYMCEKGYRQAMALTDEVKRKQLASYYAYEYSVLLGVSAGVRDRLLLRGMKDIRTLLKFNISNKVKNVNRLMNLTGYEITRHILCLFVKIKM